MDEKLLTEAFMQEIEKNKLDFRKLPGVQERSGMKKVFISQPMDGLTEEEILKERERAEITVRGYLNQIYPGEPVEFLDTVFRDFDGNGLKYLAKSLELLAEADVAYFAPGWEQARGCRIEHDCAAAYGKRILTTGVKSLSEWKLWEVKNECAVRHRTGEGCDGCPARSLCEVPPSMWRFWEEGDR